MTKKQREAFNRVVEYLGNFTHTPVDREVKILEAWGEETENLVSYHEAHHEGSFLNCDQCPLLRQKHD